MRTAGRQAFRRTPLLDGSKEEYVITMPLHSNSLNNERNGLLTGCQVVCTINKTYCRRRRMVSAVGTISGKVIYLIFSILVAPSIDADS